MEHHEFLPQLRRWIKSRTVKTPFNVVNVDEHHDYYYYDNLPGDPCGTWGYQLQLGWYNKYTWVKNKRSEVYDWEDVQNWFDDIGLKCSKRLRHRLGELNGDIVAAVFCVSPDYLIDEMIDCISNAVEIVARHFKMARAPIRIPGVNVDKVEGWRIAPRPMKIK